MSRMATLVGPKVRSEIGGILAETAAIVWLVRAALSAR